MPPIRIIKRPTLADQPIQTGGEQAETQPFEIPWELRELAEKNVEQHVRLTVSSWMPWRKQWPHVAEWKAINEEKKKEREKAGMEGWMKWAKDNEASIIDLGSPLGKTKRIDAKGISDTKNEITAYTIVQAESHEAAAELFANHPHFMIFPGQSVEVMECLPIPKMQ